MNEFSEDTSKQCRLCSAKSCLITLVRKQDGKIRKLIEVTIGVKIDENDYFNHVCLNCIIFAYNIHVFKENTLIREDKIQGFLKKRNMHQKHKTPVIQPTNSSLYNFCEDISSLANWIKDRRQDLTKHSDNASSIKNWPMQKTSIGIQVKNCNSTVAAQTENCNSTVAVQTESCTVDIGIQVKNSSSSVAVRSKRLAKDVGIQVKDCNSTVAVQTESCTVDIGIQVKNCSSNVAVRTKRLAKDVGIQVKDCNSTVAIQTERYTTDRGIQGEDCNSNSVVRPELGTMEIGIQVKNFTSSVALQTEPGTTDVNSKLYNEMPFNSVCMQIDNFKLKKRKLEDSKEEYLKSLELVNNVNKHMIHQNNSYKITPRLRNSVPVNKHILETIPSTPKLTRRRAMNNTTEPVKLEIGSPMDINNDSIHIKTSPRSNTPVNSVNDNLLIPYTGESLVLCKICDAALLPNTLKKHELIHRKCSICKKTFRTVKKFKEHRAECLGGIVTKDMSIPLKRLETSEEIMKKYSYALRSSQD
ncbi:unnamed protein product [Diabrotica balteata]|uniref:ZAD domain-containing protein n=1 Tax=Diabrotica balteata TaxID=107213 RepID=A0A9N9XGY0_DIABA|nr:unnamed protein product [Diabrotica balteata]